MHINNLTKLFKGETVIYLYDCMGCQWLGNCFGIYPVYGIPHMEDMHIKSLLSIPENKQDNVSVICCEDLPVDALDESIGEVEAKLMPIEIKTASGRFMAMKCGSELLYISPQIISGLCKEHSDLSFFVRMAKSGARAIVAKEGFILRAILFPYLSLPDDAFSILKDFCTLSENTKRMNEERASIEAEREKFIQGTFDE